MTDEKENIAPVRFNPNPWAWRLNLCAGLCCLAFFMYPGFGLVGWGAVGLAASFGFWGLLCRDRRIYRWGAINLAYAAGWGAALLWLEGQSRFAWPFLFLAGSWWLIGFLPEKIQWRGGPGRRRFSYGEPYEAGATRASKFETQM